ncbi:MAG: pyruvate carboxylase subunit B [Saprospiraceae bacterium]|nr:MAG: pyruvate carboxylase subunit B [Saprospiraceae bacterium]
MGKEIKFCLVYRDMWQSSGKYMPRVDQLVRVAPAIVDMDCFARVETNGGGFEQINLLFGENPNTAVRKWTTPFNKAGIQTQMLERGLNGLRMSPVPSDVRRLLFKVKKKQGTDISRSFDGLNYADNLALSFQYAREAGMIAQGALSITYSPIHTVEYYIHLADKIIELGAQEICIKDMAGVGRPASIGKMIKGIKDRHPKILVQYHAHSTPGFSVASSLEAARNGADIIDVGMEPLSWGTGHADLLTIQAMLKDAGFTVPDIKPKAYMEVRRLTQEFIDDFLGYYINPQNRFMNSLLIGPGLPGGMMGSLMADLEKSLGSLNKWMTKNDQPTLTQQDLLLKLFEEVEYVWPRLGYPPLVTPYSQYVKNVSLMNAISLLKGKPRWQRVDESTWNMILGKAGSLPGPLGGEILAKATSEKRIFFNGDPNELYPDELEIYAGKMDEKGWSYGEDDEELLEYAMHPAQYEDYKSGKAKEQFLADLAQRKGTSGAPELPTVKPAAPQATDVKPRVMYVEVNGEKFKVAVSYDEQEVPLASPPPPLPDKANGQYQAITAPLEGKFFLTKDASEKPVKEGDQIQIGQVIAYIESMKVINAVTADKSGKVIAIMARHGEEIEEDDIILKLG